MRANDILVCGITDVDVGTRRLAHVKKCPRVDGLARVPHSPRSEQEPIRARRRFRSDKDYVNTASTSFVSVYCTNVVIFPSRTV
jgi:hypothetical protein